MYGRNALAGPQPMMPPSPSGPTAAPAPPPPKWGPGFPNNQPPAQQQPGANGNDPISVLEQAIQMLKSGQMPPQEFVQIIAAIAQMLGGATTGPGPEQMQPPSQEGFQPPPSGMAG